MLLNARDPLLFSFKARFFLKGKVQLMDLGREFAKVVALDTRNPILEPEKTLGVIAYPGSGKSTFLRGVHDGLGNTFGGVQWAEVAVHGSHDMLSQKGGLLRHFDLCVDPAPEEDTPDMLPERMHLSLLRKPLPQAGLNLVEHAHVFNAPRFNYVFKIHKYNDTDRTLSLYATREDAAKPAFREFLEHTKDRRAKPVHYLIDAIERIYPSTPDFPR